MIEAEVCILLMIGDGLYLFVNPIDDKCNDCVCFVDGISISTPMRIYHLFLSLPSLSPNHVSIFCM